MGAARSSPGAATEQPRATEPQSSLRSQEELRRAQEQPAKLPNDTFLENFVFAIWLRLLASGAP